MIIKASIDHGVALEDRDNFRAFKLVVAGRRDEIGRLRAVLKGTAELVDADTAWVSEDALRCFGDLAQNAAWQQALTAMIEKARPHGWVDDARKAIKAHVEWVSSSG
jgi:hypothetical protein